WSDIRLNTCRSRKFHPSDPRSEAESDRHPAQSLRSSDRLARLLPTCSDRRAGLKSLFSVISSNIAHPPSIDRSNDSARNWWLQMTALALEGPGRKQFSRHYRPPVDGTDSNAEGGLHVPRRQ